MVHYFIANVPNSPEGHENHATSNFRQRIKHVQQPLFPTAPNGGKIREVPYIRHSCPQVKSISTTTKGVEIVLGLHGTNWASIIYHQSPTVLLLTSWQGIRRSFPRKVSD